MLRYADITEKGYSIQLTSNILIEVNYKRNIEGKEILYNNLSTGKKMYYMSS